METRTRNKPSFYPTVPFHAVRATSLVAATIVTIILIYFCYHLKNDGFKVPWTFIIVLAASVFTLAALILTTLIHCCGRLSPLFNLLVNIPILILWIVSMALLAWNIYGALSHSCTVSNWGSNQGVTVCQTYKALFAFIIFGMLAHIGQVVLDVRSRREQTRSGRYAAMGRDASDMKLEPYRTSDPLIPDSNDHHGTAYDIPGWRPQPTYADTHNYYSNRY